MRNSGLAGGGWKGKTEISKCTSREEVGYCLRACLETADDEEEDGTHEDGLLANELVAMGLASRAPTVGAVNISWRTEYTGF